MKAVEELIKPKVGINHSKINVKAQMSIFQKIILNYLQSISIIYSLNLKLPSFVYEFLGVFSNVGSASDSLISLDCFVYTNQISLPAIFIKTIFILMLPLFSILLMMMIFKLIDNFNKSTLKRNSLNSFLTIIVIICIFFQPSIIQNLFHYFSCRRINDDRYLSLYMKIKCNSDEYNKWVRFCHLYFIIKNFFYKIKVAYHSMS